MCVCVCKHRQLLIFVFHINISIAEVDKFLVQFSTVAHSRLTFATQQLQQARRLPHPSPTPELAQTHLHQVSDAIQQSHPLPTPSPPAFNLS